MSPYHIWFLPADTKSRPTRSARPLAFALSCTVVALYALANLALDRALPDDPGYSMAQLLRDVIDAGIPPSMARLPMTPEKGAASYGDAAEEPPEGETDRSRAVGRDAGITVALADHDPLTQQSLQRQGHLKIVSNRFAETIFRTHP